MTLDSMNKGRAPLPCLLGLITLPEAVENSFRETRAKETRNINVLVNFLSPVISHYGFVLDTPNKGRFFLSSFYAPGVFPMHVDVPWQDIFPSCLVEIHFLIHVAYPLSSCLCGELEYRNATWLAISIGIKAQLQDRIVEEFDRIILSAFENLCDLDFLYHADELILVIQILLQSCMQVWVGLDPKTKIGNSGKGSKSWVDRVNQVGKFQD